MKHAARFDASVKPSDLLAAFPDPTLIIGRNGRVIAANREAALVFGYRREELLDLPVEILVPARFRPAHASQHADYAAHPVARAMGGGLELVALRKDGTEFPAEISVSPLKSRGDTVFIAAVRDLTRRRVAQDAREEERRWFLDRVITAQDDERRRIARELHDEAGQALASLIVRLRALEDAPSLGEARVQAARLRKGLADTIGGLGRLARGLHPSLLDDLGLGPALKRHAADSAEALGIRIRVSIKGLGARRLPIAVETALYRIAQEALTNVARHARAKRVDVSLSRSDSTVQLVVSDDGRGFDPHGGGRSSLQPPSLGLLGIRERASALGGAAVIESAPGRGTVVTASLPLPAPRSPARRPAKRTPKGRAR